MVFGKPLFLWFGILGFVTIVLALWTGLARANITTHKMLAFVALGFLVLHVLGVLGVY